jgi:hypothetical protein
MSVTISFIEKINGSENFILTSVLDVYPSYKQGDLIHLQKTNHIDGTDEMRVTSFTILDVQHSIREVKSINFKTQTNPLGIKNHIGIEVYLKKEE